MTFEQILAIVRRSLPLVLIGMLGFGLVALVYTLISPHVYQATARVQLETKGPSIATNTDTLRDQPTIDPASIDTEVEYLESRSIAERVVRDAKLVSDPEFGDGSVAATVDKFADALQIKRVSTTYLIDISVDSRSPQRAAELANQTARAYIALQKEGKRAVTLNDNRLLRERVDAMAGEVQRAEADVQRFRIANDLLSVNGTTVAEQSTGTINDQLATARAQERAAMAEYSSAAASGASLGQANSQQSLGSLRIEQAQASQAMSEAQARFGVNHPNYLAAQGRLAQVDAAVAGEIGRAREAVSANKQQQLSDLRAKAAAAGNLRRSLEGSAGANEAGLARNSRATTGLGELNRRAAALRSTYETYLNRYQQTLTQLGTERSNANVVALASAPTQYYKPNLKLNLALGLLTGLLAGITVAALTALLASHFSTAQQIETALDVEALPALPTAASIKLPVGKRAGTAEMLRAMTANPTGAFAEMHKNLLVAISRPVGGKLNQVIALTSALPKEGKTTAAVCLAAVAAHAGRRTLLIDCDQRRRSATRQLAGEPTVGLHDVVNGRTPLAAALLDVGVPGLDLLPASGSEDSGDMFGTEQFTKLIGSLRERYDLILLDTAPLLPIADTRLIVERADSVVMFCRWRSTSKRAVEAAMDILGRAGTPIAGVSLTLVDIVKQAKFGYGDPTFYYSKYKDYYVKTA